jgi:hypothetical protein
LINYTIFANHAISAFMLSKDLKSLINIVACNLICMIESSLGMEHKFFYVRNSIWQKNPENGKAYVKASDFHNRN